MKRTHPDGGLLARYLYGMAWLSAGLIVFALAIQACEKIHPPPIARFIFSPNTGSTETEFTFDASNSFDYQNESETIQVRWDWSNDGIWDTDYSFDKVYTHLFSELGDHKIALEVKDARGHVGSARKTIRISPNLPQVKTVNLETIHDQAIRIHGEVLKDGGSPVIHCGACWSTHENPTVGDQSAGMTGQRDTFSVIANDLFAGLTYYFRTYATNSRGTAYGDAIKLTTPGLPVVHTSPLSDIQLHSAKCGGSITSDGGSPITRRGVCWFRFRPPVITDSKTQDEEGTGDFESNLQQLRAGTVYYVRAYAVNHVGISYGEIRTLKTISTVPEMEIWAIVKEDKTSVAVSSNLTFDGGEKILERGACISLNPNPTTADKKSSDGATPGLLIHELTGLEPGRIYHIRAYATNSVGTGYSYDLMVSTDKATLAFVLTAPIANITSTTAESGGTIQDNGGSGIIEKGVCWHKTMYPTIQDPHTKEGSGSDPFTSSLTSLTPNTWYFVRAYAINGVGTSYGNQVSFRTK